MWWTARRIDIFGPLPPPNTSNTHVFWAVGVNVQAIAAAYPSDPDALGLAAEARMNISPWWVCGPRQRTAAGSAVVTLAVAYVVFEIDMAAATAVLCCIQYAPAATGLVTTGSTTCNTAELLSVAAVSYCCLLLLSVAVLAVLCVGGAAPVLLCGSGCIGKVCPAAPLRRMHSVCQRHLYLRRRGAGLPQ
jgi:hypothetical protein